MKPSPFEYLRAHTVEEAVAALASTKGDAILLAGGQSLMPMMNLRLVAPERVIDISALQDLNYIQSSDGSLSIGAVTKHNVVLRSDLVAKHCPLVSEGYGHVAHETIRNRGTIGGSICHNDPASEMPLVLTVMDAVMTVAGTSGERQIAATDFFIDMMETSLKPGEMLTKITMPNQDAGEGYAFEEVSQRKGDFAIVAAATRFSVNGGLFRNVRFGLGGAGADKKRFQAVEAAIEGQPVDEATISNALLVAVAEAAPDEDIHSDVQYKLDLVATLGRRVIERAVAMTSAD